MNKIFTLLACLLTTVSMVAQGSLQPKQVIHAVVECVDFEWPTCEYDGVAGMFIFADQDVPSRAFNVAVAAPTGEFNETNGIVKTYTGMADYSTMTPYRIDNGTVKLDANMENLTLNMEVSMVCEDEIQYKFTCQIPFELRGTTSLSYNNMKIDATALETAEGYTFNASDESTSISGFIPAQKLAGELSTEGMTITLGEVKSAKVISATVADPNTITIVFLGDDLVLYTVEAQYTVLEPEPPVNYTGVIATYEGAETSYLLSTFPTVKYTTVEEVQHAQLFIEGSEEPVADFVLEEGKSLVVAFGEYEETDGINGVASDKATITRQGNKTLVHGGRLIIIDKNGMKYDATGAQVR